MQINVDHIQKSMLVYPRREALNQNKHMTTTTSIPVKQVTYRDHNNVLCSTTYLVIKGQLCKPTKPLRFVWGPRTWNNGITYLSRKAFVFEVQGQAYRMGAKSAKPLTLAIDEVLHPMGFGGNDRDSFVLPAL